MPGNHSGSIRESSRYRRSIEQDKDAQSEKATGDRGEAKGHRVPQFRAVADDAHEITAESTLPDTGEGGVKMNYPKRVVLGTGYPVVGWVSNSVKIYSRWNETVGWIGTILKNPTFMAGYCCAKKEHKPKYRLVLERIDKEGKRK